MKKSLYAVVGQMTLSVSNYAIFVVFARLLPRDEFIGFSTAVGLNILAYAVAEGGISYVAPRELADRSDLRAGSIAGAFIAISIVLYMASLVGGYLFWNAFSNDPLDIRWITAITLYFLPTLFIPTWVTCWTMGRVGITALIMVRAAMVVAIYLLPRALTLSVIGLFFLAFVGWLLAWLNREERVIGWTDSAAIRFAGRRLRGVFAARTMSYSVYCLLPLVVGALRGNAAASNYVTGERLKAFYATMFQPFIQTIYLWQFQSSGNVVHKRLVIWMLNIANLAFFGGVLVAIHAGLLPALGNRFAEVANIHSYVVAAVFSVATATLLHIHIFPTGIYTVFHNASIGLMVTFAVLFAGMAIYSGLAPAWVLCAVEIQFFLAVLGQLLFQRGRSVVVGLSSS
jgi:hypothetical protein